MGEIELYINFQKQRATIWQERVVTKSPFLAFSKFCHIRASQKIVQVSEVVVPKTPSLCAIYTQTPKSCRNKHNLGV